MVRARAEQRPEEPVMKFINVTFLLIALPGDNYRLAYYYYRYLSMLVRIYFCDWIELYTMD